MFRPFTFRSSKGGQQSALDTVKTTSLTALAEKLRNKNAKGEDQEEEKEEKEGSTLQADDEEDDDKIHGDGMEKVVDEVDIFKNAKNRFEDRFGELNEAIETEIQMRADEAEGKEVFREGPKVATTGRIQFDDIIIEAEIPPIELCDNCEKRYSVAWCMGCQEVQCLRCVELCHPIPPFAKCHPHELETVTHPAALRQIEEGDKSSVVVEEEFPVPATFIEEHELAAIKNLDLSKPNTLATNYHDPAAFSTPLLVPYSSQPKFRVDDKVLFMDPVTHEQAYGRIISEWDHRHGGVAPPIVRGEGSMYMYIVEKIELVSRIGSLRDLMKHIAEKDVKPEYPKFLMGDTMSIPYREEFEMARELNKKMNELDEVKKFGPRRHFKESEEELARREAEKRQAELDEIARKKADFMSMHAQDVGNAGSVGESSVGGFTASVHGDGDDASLFDGELAHRDASPSSKQRFMKNVTGGAVGEGPRLASLTLEQEKKLKNEHKQMEKEALKKAAGEKEKNDEKALLGGFTSVLTKDEQLDRLREQLPQFTATPTSPRDASKRSFVHAVQMENPAYAAMERANEKSKKDKLKQKHTSGLVMGASRLATSNDLPKKVMNEKRAQNVLVLPESSLLNPADEFNMDQAAHQTQNLSRKEALLGRIIFRFVKRLSRYAFSFWVDSMQRLMEVKREFVARKIQAIARRWLARNKLQEALEYYWGQCEVRRLNLHAQFQYCERSTPFCVTMDHKLFFRTKLGANRYSVILRAKCNRIFSLVRRKAGTILATWFNVWKRNATGIDENAIKYGHFDMYAFDIDDDLEPSATGDVGEKGEHFYPGKNPQEVVQLRKEKKIKAALAAEAKKAAEREARRLARLRAMAGEGKKKHQKERRDGGEDEMSLGSAESGLFGDDDHQDEDYHHIDMQELEAEGEGMMQGHSVAESGPTGFTDASTVMSGGSRSSGIGVKKSAVVEKKEETKEDIKEEDAKAAVETWLSHPLATPGSSVSTAVQKAAFDIYSKFHKLGPRASGVDGDDESYVNVSTLQLGLVRTPAIRPTAEQEAARLQKIKEKKNMKGYFDAQDDDEGKFDPDGELPPYIASLDIKLPAAIPVWMPATAEERLHVSNSRRLTYCSYKAHMQGPSDDTSWVIPGRVMMGPIPWGRANKRTQTSSITAILLGGCDVFVSLMEEEEEIEMEKRLEIKPIASLLKSAAAKARMAVDEVVRNSNRLVADMEKKLHLIPVVDRKHENFEANKKETTRIKARVKLANEAVVRAKRDFDRLPKEFDWIRIPLRSDTCPSIQDMLPIFWHLERMMSEGRSLYLYSGDGHGRVGMMAGGLMGRLYGFTPQETLIRVQNCHDCAKREEGRKAPVSCPQLKAHRDFVVKLVSHSNKATQGTVHRSRTDPETQQEILYMPRKGTGSGLAYNDMEKVPQQPLTQSHSNVHSTETNVNKMVRVKESVQFDFSVARDIGPSWVSEHGRGDDSVPLETLYEVEKNPNRLRQMTDVIRPTDLERTDPAGLGHAAKDVDMPSLRKRREGL